MNLRNLCVNTNNTITLFSIQMQMSMHELIVTAIVIVAYFIIICNDNDCGDNNLMHAHLHLNRKKHYPFVCVSVRISHTHQLPDAYLKNQGKGTHFWKYDIYS